VAQFDMLIACFSVGGPGQLSTQKLNHWTVAKMMAKASTPRGVAALAVEYPNVALFKGAAARGEALLPNRLHALDPSQIKGYFGKSLSELEELRRNLVAKSGKRRENLQKALAAASVKAEKHQKFLKADQQCILARERELAGLETSVLYKQAGVDVKAGEVNRLFDLYVEGLTPPGVEHIPWARLIGPDPPAPPPPALPPPAVLPPALPPPAVLPPALPPPAISPPALPPARDPPVRAAGAWGWCCWAVEMAHVPFSASITMSIIILMGVCGPWLWPMAMGRKAARTEIRAGSRNKAFAVAQALASSQYQV
jgi:hypothetical protein